MSALLQSHYVHIHIFATGEIHSNLNGAWSPLSVRLNSPFYIHQPTFYQVHLGSAKNHDLHWPFSPCVYHVSDVCVREYVFVEKCCGRTNEKMISLASVTVSRLQISNMRPTAAAPSRPMFSANANSPVGQSCRTEEEKKYQKLGRW